MCTHVLNHVLQVKDPDKQANMLQMLLQSMEGSKRRAIAGPANAAPSDEGAKELLDMVHCVLAAGASILVNLLSVRSWHIPSAVQAEDNSIQRPEPPNFALAS